MTFVFDLASELEKKQTTIKVKSLISGNGWGEININSLNGSPVFLTSPIQDLKIRFQPLISGIDGFQQTHFRIDNNTQEPLHVHSLGSKYPLEINSLNQVLLMITGSEFNIFEKQRY